MFMVLSSWEFTRFIWWMQTERRVAANPQTKPIVLGCESAENWQLSSTSTIAFVIITQPVGWYSFYRRHKHCSKGAQPVLKTVYRSSCCDKHNCQWRDSNLDPLTPQSDALTTRLLRPELSLFTACWVLKSHNFSLVFNICWLLCFSIWLTFVMHLCTLSSRCTINNHVIRYLWYLWCGNW